MMAKDRSAARQKTQPKRPVKEWELRLYVAGQAPASLAAINNLKNLCEEHLAGKYHIELVDLLKDPKLSREDQIIAIPTLVRRLPLPFRKIIGDLSDTAQTLVGLQLKSRKALHIGVIPERGLRRSNPN